MTASTHSLVFNAKDGSVKILCSGEDTVITNFTREIKVRGTESGAEIAGMISISEESWMWGSKY